MNKTAYQYKDDCPATTLTSFMKRNEVTAAGAVVSKDIPANTIVAGFPGSLNRSIKIY